MDEFQHLMLSGIREQASTLKEVNTRLDAVISLVKELSSIQREQLNFFVAIDKRDMGALDTNSQEYLTELRNDGFEPKTG